ncbi:MAG: AAA family ATPase [Spirochaetales bacterium]|nr:AAA family ATPase [Spirochaetales bacterium]
MKPRKIRKLSLEELTFTVNPSDLQRYKKARSPLRVIGQPRALKALEMGIRIPGRGYNIFVAGRSGTGRKTAVQQVLKEYTGEHQPVKDIALVFNFQDPDRAGVLYLGPGKARQLKTELHRVIETMKRVIKDKLDGEPYKGQKNALLTEAEQEENRKIGEFEEYLAQRQMLMAQMDADDSNTTDLVPLVDGQAVSFDELQERIKTGDFSRDQWNRLREIYYRCMDEMRLLFSRLREKRTAVEEQVILLQKEILKEDVEQEITPLRSLCPEEEVQTYLSDLQGDILEHLYLFTAEDPPVDDVGNRSFIRYGVNILVDHTNTKKRPIVHETRPDTESLLGSVEYRMSRETEGRTNFMMIRPGSLIRSSGGFLLLEAEQILRDEETWQTLKQVLRKGTVEIYPPKSSLNLPLPAPRCEPIHINTKVILLGGEGLYDALYNTDPDIHKLFKIVAEFSDTMPRNSGSMKEYLSYLREVVEKENLKNLTEEAAARIITYGCELAEDRERLTCRFVRIFDLLIEANYWAGFEKKEEIDLPSVERALDEHRYLFNLPEEELFRQISEDTLLIRPAGKALGRVHALAVRDRGSYGFGIPMVVSCSVSPGKQGIVNIERESGLSGSLHDKGLFILEGLLRSRYALTFPLSLHSSLCFEQSYGGIDGDSASAAEACALLSALGGIPVRQDIAVTGSINQRGDLQPVGGISRKVQGFFNACHLQGLSGAVVIPAGNVRHLFLDKPVLEAVRQEKFHVYTAENLDQVVELLSEMEAGTRDSQGAYPEETLNYLVEKRLKSMAEQVKGYSR